MKDDLKPTGITLFGLEILVDKTLKADEWYLSTRTHPLQKLDEEAKTKMWQENKMELWEAIELIYEAVNELCPLPSSESLLPEPKIYAEEIIKAISRFGTPKIEVEKVLSEFDEKFPCIQPNCDNNGTLTVGNEQGEPEPEQCQYCDENRLSIKNWLHTRLEGGGK